MISSLIQLVNMAGQITHVNSNKWPKVINLFAQRLQWHHQPYHYCTHVITLILYYKIMRHNKCACKHGKYIYSS